MPSSPKQLLGKLRVNTAGIWGQAETGRSVAKASASSQEWVWANGMKGKAGWLVQHRACKTRWAISRHSQCSEEKSVGSCTGMSAPRKGAAGEQQSQDTQGEAEGTR